MPKSRENAISQVVRRNVRSIRTSASAMGQPACAETPDGNEKARRAANPLVCASIFFDFVSVLGSREKMIAQLGVALMVAAALLALSNSAVARDRAALWAVVQACRINHAITGAAFPCLEVNEADGGRSGYAVLRPPFDNDFILTPTRKIAGVEDPSLEAADAPNYFDLAWRARSVLNGGGPPPAREDVALAVNSQLARTQDQLHIISAAFRTKPGGRLPPLRPSFRRTAGAVCAIRYRECCFGRA